MLTVDQLVNRNKQLETFIDYLDRIEKQQEVTPTLLEWYGTPGIGKTQLTRMLIKLCEERGYARASIDFSIIEIEKLEKDPTKLFEQILGDLSESIELDKTDLDQKKNQFRNSSRPTNIAREIGNHIGPLYSLERPNWYESILEISRSFRHLIQRGGSYGNADNIQPIVIFFDETEKASLELLLWIEYFIISPLLKIKHCVIVWTGRHGFRWQLPDIRRHVESELLKPFVESDIGDQLRALVEIEFEESLPNLVFQLTRGNPFASWVIISQMDDVKLEDSTFSSQTISAYEALFVAEIFRRYILQYALYGLDEELKLAFQYMALLRRFDSDMLERIISRCAKQKVDIQNSDNFNYLSIKMSSTQLVDENFGLQIIPNLRYLIWNYFRTHEPETFRAIHNTALDVYNDRLRLTDPVEPYRFIVEELFHFASLQSLGEQIDLENRLETRLESYPIWFNDKDEIIDDLTMLRRQLIEDLDLRGYINTDSISELTQRIDKFQTSI